jgi:predicted SnoaL-like aldol condensation-catalyzing enzyme
VLDFYNELYKGEATGDLKDRIAGIAEKYMLPDYIQHNPAFGGPGGGREAFIRAMRQQAAARPRLRRTLTSSLRKPLQSWRRAIA